MIKNDKLDTPKINNKNLTCLGDPVKNNITAGAIDTNKLK